LYCQKESKQYQTALQLLLVILEDGQLHQIIRILSSIHQVIIVADTKHILLRRMDYELTVFSSFIPNSEGPVDSEYFNHSEESSQFRQEYEMRKLKQVHRISALLHFSVFMLKQKGSEFLNYFVLC
jgi:hypothetical protein